MSASETQEQTNSQTDVEEAGKRQEGGTRKPGEKERAQQVEVRAPRR
jgi:hypothetical protein